MVDFACLLQTEAREIQCCRAMVVLITNGIIPVEAVVPTGGLSPVLRALTVTGM